MAVFRKIHVSFWQDPFVLSLTPEQKYFYLYLMTNSKTRQCGIYELPKSVMVFETGYNSETVEKLIKFFTENEKIQYDYKTNEVLLINWHKHNFSTSPKVKNCIKDELKTVKSKELLYSMDTLYIQYGYSIHTVSQKEKEKEEEREEEKEYKISSTNIPTEKEVIEYCEQTKINLDKGKLFFAHYSAQGWRRANNVPVQNWKQLLHYWIANDRKNQKNNFDDEDGKSIRGLPRE